MIKGNINLKALKTVPGMRTFSVEGMTMLSDGDFFALIMGGRGFMGSLTECEEAYPTTMAALKAYMPRLF